MLEVPVRGYVATSKRVNRKDWHSNLVFRPVIPSRKVPNGKRSCTLGTGARCAADYKATKSLRANKLRPEPRMARDIRAQETRQELRRQAGRRTAGARVAPSSGCSLDQDPHRVHTLTRIAIFLTGTRQKLLDVFGIDIFLFHSRRRGKERRRASAASAGIKDRARHPLPLMHWRRDGGGRAKKW
jgi:hypothetical protein